MTKEIYFYQISHGPNVSFVHDESVPLNMLYWDTVSLYNEVQNQIVLAKSMKVAGAPPVAVDLQQLKTTIYYNTPENGSIKEIKDSLNTVYSKYITGARYEFLAKTPLPQAELPYWAGYNPERKCYSFDQSLFLEVGFDFTKTKMCVHLTKNSSSQISQSYKFANRSKNPNCSSLDVARIHGKSLVLCHYSNSSSPYFHDCSYYEADEKKLFVHDLVHKINKKSFQIETTFYRSGEDIYSVDIKDITNNILISQLKYKDVIFDKDKTSLYEEINFVVDALSNNYIEDYDITLSYNYIDDGTQQVSISKKAKNSYISTLSLEDSNDNKNNKLLTTF